MLLWPFNKYPGTDYETFNWEWLIKLGKKWEDIWPRVEEYTNRSEAAAAGAEQSAAEAADSATLAGENADRAALMYIEDEFEYADAIHAGGNKSYFCRTITVNDPITINSASDCVNEKFIGATFIMNSDMFTWTTPTAYHAIPSYEGCTFVGNGHDICGNDSYLTYGKFTDCTFIDCGLVKNGHIAQSQRFVNCRVANEEDHPFIDSKSILDVRFENCQVESDNHAPIINGYGTTNGNITHVSFVDCIIEGQLYDSVIYMHDGYINCVNLYTEANHHPFVKVLPTNRTVDGILKLKFDSCKIQHEANVMFADIDESYEGSIWASFECHDSHLAVCTLTNTSNLNVYDVTNINIDSGGRMLPSIELSKALNLNSVASFPNTNTVIVKKFPALITCDSSIGGWHTNMLLVSLSYNNTPCALFLNDPSTAVTAVYDDNTGYVTVTLPQGSSVSSNRTAVFLGGQENHLANILTVWSGLF